MSEEKPGLLTVLPTPTLYLDLALPDASADRPYVIVNMVATADGKAAVGGRAMGIGSRADRAMMNRIRAAVDFVLVGAGTLRAEGFDPRVSRDDEARRLQRGMSPRPLAAVITRSGDVPLERGFFRQREPRPIAITSRRGLAESSDRFAAIGQLADVHAFGEDQVDLAALLAFARSSLGVRRLLAEGGPSLNQRLFALGLVDELFLTLAPRIVGGQATTIVEDDTRPTLDIARLALISVAEQDGELFLRYRVKKTPG